MVQLGTEEAKRQKSKHRFGDLISKHRALALLLLILFYVLIFSLIYPGTFLKFENFQKILLNMSAEGFICIALAILLISADIDLSLGANMALSGVACGYIILFGPFGQFGNMMLAIVATLILSMSIGCINGLLISKLGVVAMITTLATSTILQGIAVWLAGPGLTNFPKEFQAIGGNVFLGLRLPVWYLLIGIIIFQYLMTNNSFFKNYYFLGGNKKATELSGINTNKQILMNHMIAGLLAGVSGIIATSRFNSAMTSVGTGVELRAITAAILGGVSFTGGKGTITGAAMGALFIAFLNNGLTIAGVDPYVQNVITGVILVLAIVLDIIANKSKVKK